MQQHSKSPKDPLKPRWPWEVVRTRKPDFDPANPLRYSHTWRLAIAVAVFTVAIFMIAGPARAVQTEMLADVEAAKAAGFPQLPPEFAGSKQISNFIVEWNLDVPGSLSRQQIQDLAMQMGEYGNDAALLNFGIMSSLIAIVFMSAVAFSRASNNLYALGYPLAKFSPTWAAVSWFIPLLSFVLPWLVVDEIYSRLWSDPGNGEESSRSLWPSVLAGVWGLSFIGLWLLNPFTVHTLLPANDINAWITKIVWAERLMVWLPITTFITTAALLVATAKQHKRYRLLDARAVAGR